jgi:hypothetical protein
MTEPHDEAPDPARLFGQFLDLAGRHGSSCRGDLSPTLKIPPVALVSTGQ